MITRKFKTKYRLFIVTDPCYLISDEKVWEDYCCIIYDARIPTEEERYRLGDEFLSHYLDTEIHVCKTGYGDWSNELYSVSSRVLKSRFVADSGLVCVTELTDKVNEEHKKRYGYGIREDKHCIALFFSTNLKEVKFDTSNPEWTRICIKDTERYHYWTPSFEEHFGDDEE